MFPTEESAKAAAASVSVDPELRPDRVQREITVSGATVRACVRGNDAKFVRVSVSGMLEMFALATSTLAAFAE